MTTFAMQGAIQIRKLQKAYIGREMSLRLANKLMPMSTENVSSLTYERRNVTRGVQFARGFGGAAGQIQRPGMSSFQYSPGAYSDEIIIDENQLRDRRQVGTWTEYEDEKAVSDDIARQTTDRYLDRYEKNVFDLLCTGGFELKGGGPGAGGPTIHRQIFPIRQFTPGVLFNDLNNSTPIQYFRSLMPLLQLGVSVDFRIGWAIANRNTINNILNNQNTADVLGRRVNSGDTVNSLAALNQYLASNDVFQLTEYHKGWYPETEGLPMQTFVPDGKILLAGVREDGEPIGKYVLARNANNNNSAPGDHFVVEDERKKTPPFIKFTAGHVGGPVPEYIEALALVNAY